MISTSAHATDVERLYPAVLRVAGRPCVVVGGGAVAARKAAALAAAGARVTVVAPALGETLDREVRQGSAGWRWVERSFEEGDVAGALLVVAATDDADANRRVAQASREAGALVNVVDDPAGSDFLVPSVLERGSLQIAVSTAGRAPAVSAAVRRSLEPRFSQEWAEVVEILGAARDAVRGEGYGEAERLAVNRSLAQIDLAAVLEAEGVAGVRRAVADQRAAADHGHGGGEPCR